MEGAGPYLKIVGLKDYTSVFRPIFVHGENQALKGTGRLHMGWK